MPRKKQAGFIFTEQLGEASLAKVIAHEIGHGAFRLEHTFDTYNTLEKSSTDNLMDYQPNGITLHKYQWDLIHDPAAVLGLFEGDEGGAMYDCPRWFSGECEDVGRILDLIKKLATEGKNIEVSGPLNQSRKELIAENIKLDGTSFKAIKVINLVEKGKKVTYNARDYENYNQKFLSSDGKEDNQLGLVYRSRLSSLPVAGVMSYAPPEITKILVYDDYEKIEEKISALKKYLFGEIPTAIIAEILEKLKQEELSPMEIKAVRGLIAKVQNDQKKTEFYLKLQEKVPYHSQRDNESIATDEDVENNSKWLNAGETAGDIMCNLTSEAMCLEYLGISCPNPDMQFEDYLEDLRREKGFEHRGDSKTRQDLSNELGVNFKYIELDTDDKKVLISKLKPELEKGRAVLLAAFSSPKGHIVRLQSINDEGLVIDDPYGKVQNFSERENGGSGYTNGKNSKDSSDIKGKDNLWTWENIKDTIIKYAEVYYID